MTRRQADPTTIGGRLKMERNRLGLSQTALTAIMGAKGKTGLAWEANRTAPNAVALAAFAHAGADVTFIITGERHPAHLPRTETPSPDKIVRKGLAALATIDRRALLLVLLAEELAG